MCSFLSVITCPYPSGILVRTIIIDHDLKSCEQGGPTTMGGVRELICSKLYFFSFFFGVWCWAESDIWYNLMYSIHGFLNFSFVCCWARFFHDGRRPRANVFHIWISAFIGIFLHSAQIVRSFSTADWLKLYFHVFYLQWKSSWCPHPTLTSGIAARIHKGHLFRFFSEMGLKFLWDY